MLALWSPQLGLTLHCVHVHGAPFLSAVTRLPHPRDSMGARSLRSGYRRGVLIGGHLGDWRQMTTMVQKLWVCVALILLVMPLRDTSCPGHRGNAF